MKGGGAVSEWNEGNFKNLRLHEAQELINVSKISPLSMSDKKMFNYELWIIGIDILFGEGRSKYEESELNDMKRIINTIQLTKRYFPIHKKINEPGREGKKTRYVFNEDNWIRLKELIDIYEHKIKFFNDIHGLSTRNIYDDDDGL